MAVRQSTGDHWQWGRNVEIKGRFDIRCILAREDGARMDRLALGNYMKVKTCLGHKMMIVSESMSRKRSHTHVRVLLAGCLGRGQPLKRSTFISSLDGNLCPS